MDKYFIKEYSGFYTDSYEIGRYNPDEPTDRGDYLADIITIDIDKGNLIEIESSKEYIAPEVAEKLKEVTAEDYLRAEALLSQTISNAKELLKTL